MVHFQRWLRIFLHEWQNVLEVHLFFRFHANPNLWQQKNEQNKISLFQRP